MTSRLVSSLLCLSAGCYAAVIFPGAITVPGTSASGTSFTVTGTLTQADTITFTESGAPCLQSASVYCTNGAGVLTTAGSLPVGSAGTFSGTFNGTTGTFDFGALLLEISGAGAVQVFPANAANGLGSATPPTSLSVSGATLGSLGFSNFSVVNPTITFVVADTIFSDNSGAFTLRQASAVPEPALVWLPASALLALAQIARRRRL
jgi:hypothetical protein